MKKISVALLLALTLSACEREPAAPAVPTTLSINPTDISVSGLSAGGYMASQLHVAHSARINGVGIIAAGPWGCAKGNINRALSTCLAGGDLGIDELTHDARDAAAAGKIDTLNNLRGARVFVFRGTNDAVVSEDVSYATVEFYEQLGDGKQIEYVDSIAAAHGIPTLDTGADCATMSSPFLNNCNYDAAGALLVHVTGREATPATSATGTWREIDQREHSAAGLADTGLVYVPEQCSAGTTCDLHVVLHGCQQSTAFVERDFVEQAGFNRWADALGLVVLYPQVNTGPTNPLGCWDWWGYTGENYSLAAGPQVSALMALIDSLTQAPR